MARKSVVSRTFKTNSVTVLGLDIITAEPSNKTVTLPRVMNEKDTLKAVKKILETDTYKVVAIVEQNVTETLYAMPEEDFLKYATPVENAETTVAESMD